MKSTFDVLDEPFVIKALMSFLRVGNKSPKLRDATANRQETCAKAVQGLTFRK